LILRPREKRKEQTRDGTHEPSSFGQVLVLKNSKEELEPVSPPTISPPTVSSPTVSANKGFSWGPASLFLLP